MLQGCALKHLAQPAAESSVLQKRLAYDHSEVVTLNLVESLIAGEETLLVAAQSTPDGWPLPSISTVVLVEEKLCAVDKSKRQQWLNEYKNDPGLPSQFQLLLLASCAPDFTPSVLARSLKQVRNARQWPATYLAYFDLLERHHQALVRLENLYGNLKQRMDSTIEKLTEIEVQTQP